MWLRLTQSWHTVARSIDAWPAWVALSLGTGLALLAWLVPGALVIVPLLLVAAGALASTAQPLAVTVEELTAPPGTLARKYQFDVVTLDERGKLKDRRRGSARGWAERLPGGVLLAMVEVPGGTFLMGSPESEAGRQHSEAPQHRVTVPAFAIGRYPVTQAQWRAVASLPEVERRLEDSPSRFRFRGGSRPVEQVSWHDTVELCARLTKASGRVYRLPSEGEWEYAARAGTTTPFHLGATITPEWVNYDGNFPYASAQHGRDRERTTRVGALPRRVWPSGRGTVANAFGLCDVHGNVWEWCQDMWHDNYDRASADGSAWESGGDANRRVLRGGAWYADARNCRSAVRDRNGPENGNRDVGFRVVCAVSRTQKPGAL
jgi:formylglycine-generating enzyme required for sulfatase activity